jgi:beta-lactamase class A
MRHTFVATTRIVVRAAPLLAALALASCPRPPSVPVGAAPGGVRSAAPATVTPTARPERLAAPLPAIGSLEGDDGLMRGPQAYHLLGPPQPPIELLVRQLEEVERSWGGVLGVYVYNLAADREVAGLHQETVFSGASVLKAAIMLHAYAELPSFSQEQDDWLHQMIVDSDNWAANVLLAASAGGSTPNDSARGALHMSAMLASLGLQHTYLRTPYAIEDYPIDLSGLDVAPGPEQEGAPPYTVADPWLRATPAEIGRVFLWLERCVQGRGPLPARFGATLTPARCREMIGLLEQNGDRSRLVAGVPEGTLVAHKSGWIGDTQGDVGIVHSPGGDYLLALFVYRDADTFDSGAAAATIAEASGMVYRYFNP